ncbi:MAG: endonuclease/exonuclease/phosphatase family protein [Bdellovibrionota bacterium]
MKKSRLRILSYNIHKGFSTGNSRFVLGRMKEAIELVHADLVLLQEVIGHHEVHRNKVIDWPTVSQFEFIADKLWPHYAYGKNAIYTLGHHGNAILSKYPILEWENLDVSTNRLERRGLLHAVIKAPRGLSESLHVICLHLGLLESERGTQVNRLCDRIEAMVPVGAPLIVGGDFNDWRGKITKKLDERLSLSEAFLCLGGSHARTFPSWLPVFRLDRVYFRGLAAHSAECLTGPPWNELSDHAAIITEMLVK